MTNIHFPQRDNDGSGSGRRQNDSEGEGKGFARVLETECSRSKEPVNIRVQTNGYSRLGMPTTVFIKMREYV